MRPFALALSLALAAPAAGQAPAGQAPAGARTGPAVPLLQELKPGAAVEGEIGPESPHALSVRLDRGVFFRASVEQKGIDLVVRLIGPDGARLAEVDSPNGEWGPEPITLETRAAGVYRIEIAALTPDAKPGKYAARIVSMRPAATTPEGRIDQLFSQWESREGPGCAVAVVRGDTVAFERGYGSANLEYDIPVTPKTVFHVASVTKQFTAFAVAMLARDGKLSLDDDVRKFIPEVPDFGKTITLRHLLNHTSGLYDQWEALAMAGWRIDDVITKEHILELVRHERRLNFDPGTRHLYCNTGFTLLAEVVARVSGKSFAQYCRENIFAPLGMSTTHVHDDVRTVVKNRAYSYGWAPGGYQYIPLNYSNAGATSLFTTADDLTKWLANFGTARVGGPEVLREMRTEGVLASGEKIGYGLGIGVGSYKGLATISHGGADAGYRSFVLWFPDQRFGVVVLSNAAETATGQLAYGIADIYLGDAFAPAPKPPEPLGVATVDAKVLGDYVGTYRLGLGWLLDVTVEDGKLMVQATDEPKFATQPRSDTSFFVPAYNAAVAFERDAGGRVNRIAYKGIEAPRVAAFAPTPDQLAEYTGRYYSDELGATYDVAVADGRLVAVHRRTGAVALAPVIRDEFKGNRGYAGAVQFVRDAGGRVTGLVLAGGRVKGVAFEKVACAPVAQSERP